MIDRPVMHTTYDLQYVIIRDSLLSLPSKSTLSTNNDGLKPKLVEHCTGIAEVVCSIPVQAGFFFFFRAKFQ